MHVPRPGARSGVVACALTHAAGGAPPLFLAGWLPGDGDGDGRVVALPGWLPGSLPGCVCCCGESLYTSDVNEV